MDTHTLNVSLLCAAYANGYFPMPHPETEEILWFRPDPRAILPLSAFHCSHSLRRALHQPWEIRRDTAFCEVMEACGEREKSWINEEMTRVYRDMFDQGFAHSLEVWREGQLVGGLYGVALKGAFFAESKFHRQRDASKVALFHLVQHLTKQRFKLLEVQFLTPHLAQFGVCEIPDNQYQKLLREALKHSAEF